jgi:methylated-DNA-[protein]-cysteine S-methyltransferase
MMSQRESPLLARPPFSLVFPVHTPPTSPLLQTHCASPLGELLLAATEQGLVGVWFLHGQQHMPDTRDWQTHATHPTFKATAQQLLEYFHGQRRTFELPLHVIWGTPFQRDVWQALQNIPFGQTSTYVDIARHIGNAKAMRAVGAAIGQNPLSIVVPCHRVVGSNGALTGFAGGLERKRQLLAHEASCA